MHTKKDPPPGKYLHLKVSVLVLILLFSECTNTVEKSNDHYSGKIFEFNNASEPRWSSNENLNGAKGAGGKENNGGKGHKYDYIQEGKTKTLIDIKGQGIINRIWITINDR